jgi:hypothetical protein
VPTPPKLWPRLAAVLISLAVASGIAEIGLRLAFRGDSPAEVRAKLLRSEKASLAEGRGQFSLIGLVKPSPFDDVIYELKPSVSGVFRDHPLHVNALGLRGPEVARAKPPGTFRIVEPYLQIVERRLNAAAPAGRRFEVLNFAVPGYNGAMEAAVFERKAAAFDPDLVVIHFIGNDFGPPHFLRPPGPAGDAADSGSRSYLWTLLRGLAGDQPPADSPELFHDLSQLPQAVRREAHEQVQHMQGEEGYRRAMDRLGRAARARKVPVILLSLGDGNERGRIAREAAEANGFTYLDAGPRFYAYLVEHHLESKKANWVSTFRIPKDGHPNALGHALYADVLFEALKGSGVAGATPPPPPS